MQFPLRSAFIGLPLEGEAKETYRELQERLLPFEDILRFQQAGTVHLTLQFWRELLEIEYGQVWKQLPVLAQKLAPFPLRVEGVDTFGSRGEDRVLFLSVPFSEPLARLRKLCPWPTEKPFHPHITIARIHHPQRFHRAKKEVLKMLKGVSFTMHVTLLRLYAEIDGRKQTPIADFPLGMHTSREG